MWTICEICGAIVADTRMHNLWHDATGTDVVLPDPMPAPAPEPTTDPTEV